MNEKKNKRRELKLITPKMKFFFLSTTLPFSCDEHNRKIVVVEN
jgi:hypothetical protein